MTNSKTKSRPWPLHYKIIMGLIAGVIWAFLASYAGWAEFTSSWIAPFGEVFIHLLKLIAVPLILFSIIHGISGLSDTKSLGRMGLKTLALYLVTTVSAVLIGLILVNIVRPGHRVTDGIQIVNRLSYELWADQNQIKIKDNKRYSTDSKYAEYLKDAESKNLEELQDQSIQAKVKTATAQKETGPLQMMVDMIPSNIFGSFQNSKMLQIIFFSIFFGVTLVSLPRTRIQGMLSFIEGGNEVFIRMVDIVMMGAPYFVFALMAGKLTEMASSNPEKIIHLLGAMLVYMATVVLGLCILIFVFYPFLLSRKVKRIGYKQFFKAMAPAQFLAFSSSSSAATLPVTMECVNQGLGVKEEVSSFVLPVGATVNMDGTSLYQAVAVVFLAQLHGVDLNLTQQITIILTATLASIGTAAVPSAGLIMLIIVLQSVGLNPAWIALIFPVDRILDMSRTVANITGDATVSCIVAESEGMLEVPSST